MRTLIAYFSRAGENYFNGVLKVIQKGNTEVAAQMLAELTGADLFQIEPIQPYSLDYNTCINEAGDDLKRNARPELKRKLNGIEGYDVIYLGYPNYWGTMPMPMFTFLEMYDFAGKIIKPFCTNEGSGMGTSMNDIKKLCPHAIVKEGLSIHGSKVKEAQNQIKDWCLK